MEKDLRIPLRDILDSCDRIIANVSSVDVDAFRMDVNLQGAVIRRFEIIGEAVKRVPDALRAQYSEVPWKEAAGFRDVLIHDYPNIVIDQVYFTGKNYLTEFRDQIRKILNQLG